MTDPKLAVEPTPTVKVFQIAIAMMPHESYYRVRSSPDEPFGPPIPFAIDPLTFTRERLNDKGSFRYLGSDPRRKPL